MVSRQPALELAQAGVPPEEAEAEINTAAEDVRLASLAEQVHGTTTTDDDSEPAAPPAASIDNRHAIERLRTHGHKHLAELRSERDRLRSERDDTAANYRQRLDDLAERIRRQVDEVRRLDRAARIFEAE